MKRTTSSRPHDHDHQASAALASGELGATSGGALPLLPIVQLLGPAVVITAAAALLNVQPPAPRQR